MIIHAAVSNPRDVRKSNCKLHLLLSVDNLLQASLLLLVEFIVALFVMVLLVLLMRSHVGTMRRNGDDLPPPPPVLYTGPFPRDDILDVSR
jgi:hypothetical protein